MYSVMIVDDEEPVLESYSFMIEHDAPDFSLCAKARTGFEAIAMAHQKRPDIVIMDIGIPGMDGLDTIGELQKVYPETLFILSTAYERFDLAQRAIPLGVFNYLVKPISRKTFLDTLKQAGDHILERKQRSTDRLATARLAADALSAEQRNLLYLVTWKSVGDAEWARYRSMFSLSSDHAYLLLVRIESANAQDHYTEVVNRFSRRFQCLSTDYRGDLLLLVCDIAGADRAGSRLREILDSILTGSDQWAVAEGSRRRYDELYRSFEEATASLPTDGGDRPGTGIPDDSIGPLRHAVARASSFEEIYPLFTRYWEVVFMEDPFPVAKARMVALFSLLIEDLAQRPGDEAAARIAADPVREIMETSTLQEWNTWASRALRVIVELNLRVRDQHLPAPLARAIRHVDNHFEQPLQLSTLADRCGVSAGYLSRLFSEHLSTNFADYLNLIRIKEAERRLTENRLSVKEIAYAVGYQDPNYFSRIFKKFKGISPTSYLSRGTEYED